MRRTGRPDVLTIPVNVIADGRPALVVGYGKVGQRKERLLLEAGVPVEVIAPERNRAFAPGDAAGKLLVFACTDDKHVNRAVLEDARAHHVPCCVSDMNWADGDFVTPATARVGGAVVGVSTNGASCANAKTLKDAIADFLRRRADEQVYVIGTSDRFLDAARRAPFQLPPERRREMVGFIGEVKGVEEFVVLNTCNRVEVAIRGSVRTDVIAHLMHFHRLRPDEFYVLEGEAAFAHLVRVTAGLESDFAGEFHVVSQVKDAVAEAEAAGTLTGPLKGFFDEVLRVAKDVRHAVAGLLEVTDVDDVAAARVAAQTDVATARIVVMGTGALGRDVVRRLTERGGSPVAIHHGDPVPPCDALVCACAGPAPFVTADRLPAGGVPLVIDLGMPPNVADGVPHVSLDDLKRERRARSGALKAVSEVVDRILRERTKA